MVYAPRLKLQKKTNGCSISQCAEALSIKRNRRPNVQKSKHITQEIRRRWERLRDHGCIACKKEGIERFPEIHHLVSGYRMGHESTIPLCSWHHRGVPVDIDFSKSQTAQWMGPSMAENKREFEEKYGSELELLREIDQWLDPDHTKDDEKKAQEVNGSSLPF